MCFVKQNCSFCVCRSWYGCWHLVNGLPLGKKDGPCGMQCLLACGLFYPRLLPQCGNLFPHHRATHCDQLDEFCTLVTSNMANEIHWPHGEEAEMSVVGFLSTVGLPDTLCVVGTCFIPIEKPTDVPDPEVYRDAGGSYSVNSWLFATTRVALPMCLQSTLEIGITQESCQPQRLERHCGKPLWLCYMANTIIGNSTFPLSEHFLTPFPDYATLGQKKVCYNQKVQSSLAVAQGSIHTLRSFFRGSDVCRSILFAKTSLAVKTCCILYNMFLETYNVPVDCIGDDVTQKTFPWTTLWTLWKSWWNI